MKLQDLTKEQVSRIGVEKDKVLAEEWGVKKDTVGFWRRQKIIPAAGRRFKTLTYAEKSMLGVLPDSTLAELWGVGRGTVGVWRETVGAQVCARGRGTQEPDDEAFLNILSALVQQRHKVWVCPACGSKEVQAHVSAEDGYLECINEHTWGYD